MPTDTLIVFASLLAMLAASAERLVELVKGWWPSLNLPRVDPVLEAQRKWKVNALALVCSLITAFVAAGPIGAALGWQQADYLSLVGNHLAALVGLGLFAAGGSSFWNSVLSYLVSTKNIKKADAARAEAEEAAARARALLEMSGGMPAPGSTTF